MYSIGGETQTLDPAPKDAAFDPVTKIWSQKEAPQGLENSGSNSAATYNGRIYLFSETGSLVYDPANDLN